MEDEQKEKTNIESNNENIKSKNKTENTKSIFDKYCLFEVSDDEILNRKNV